MADKESFVNGPGLPVILLAGLLAPAWLPPLLRGLFNTPGDPAMFISLLLQLATGAAIVILAVRYQLRRRAEQARELADEPEPREDPPQ